MIDIIIPVYNAEKYLNKLFTSLFEQTYKNWRAILIDDGSTDNTSKIIDFYTKIDNRVIKISQKNRGAAAARNVGLKYISSKYVMFWDADDYADNNYLEVLFDIINCYGCDMVRSGYYIESPDGKAIVKKLKNNANNTSYQLIKEYCLVDDPGVGALWGKLFRSELFDNISFTEGVTIGEDFEVLVKVTMNCKKIVSIDRAFYHYLQWQNSILHSGFDEKYFDNINNLEKVSLLVCKENPELKTYFDVRLYIEKLAAFTKMMKNDKYDYLVIENNVKHIRQKLLYFLLFKGVSIKFKLSAVVISISYKLFFILYKYYSLIK